MPQNQMMRKPASCQYVHDSHAPVAYGAISHHRAGGLLMCVARGEPPPATHESRHQERAEAESADRGRWLAGRRRLRIHHGGVLACAASAIRDGRPCCCSDRPALASSCPMHDGIETALLNGRSPSRTGLGRVHHTLHLDGRSGRTSGLHGRTDGTTTGRTSSAVVYAHECACDACVNRCVPDLLEGPS